MQATVERSRYLLAFAEPVLTQLDDSHRALEPMPGAKTAGWLVGHLAVSGDFARRLCGRPALCPAAWRSAFAPGSHPSLQAGDYPPMLELTATFFAVYRDLCDAALAATPDVLAAANPYAPARTAFPTVHDFVAYLMTAHLVYHLGQLTGWRAAAGLGRIHRPDSLAA
jgi:uncharacterized damage-inducible protein DinB